MPQIVNDFLSIDWKFPDKEKIKRMLVVPLFEKGAVGALIGVAGKGRDYDQQDVHHLSLLLKGIWKKVEQKRFEMELIQAKNRAEESDKLKSAFLATMSHELRTPLNAIIGFSDLLMDEDNKDFMVEFSNTINQSGKHLLEIIEEVFLISELESVEIKLKSNLFEAEKLLLKAHKECIEFATSSGKGHLEIEVDADPQLKQVLVKADFERLTQLYGQLVRNAVKFTQKGKITIGLGFQNNTPVFFVSDTGIGIESKHLSKVTDRFYQIEQTLSREYSGIGLGLTIAKKIIELYNGKIWIDSEPGKGTTVYFTFPAFIINVLQPLGEKEFD
jgi:signal transduction histidine kinase